MSVVGARLAGLTDLSTVQTALRQPTISQPRVSVCGVWLSNAKCLPAYRPVALAIVGARPPWSCCYTPLTLAAHCTSTCLVSDVLGVNLNGLGCRCWYVLQWAWYMTWLQ